MDLACVTGEHASFPDSRIFGREVMSNLFRIPQLSKGEVMHLVGKPGKVRPQGACALLASGCAKLANVTRACMLQVLT